MAKYFSPLDKKSCVYFLIISAIFFVMLVLVIFINLFWMLKNYKQINFRIITGGLIMLFNIFIAYFVNRLLYSMCTKSLDLKK
jgi:uncharacterized BrkB/YihY/UPF0761 family membrane protein